MTSVLCIQKNDFSGRFSMLESVVANAIASSLRSMEYDAAISVLEEAAGISYLCGNSSLAWDTAQSLRELEFVSDLATIVCFGYLGTRAVTFASTKLGRMRLGRVARGRQTLPNPVSASPYYCRTRQGRFDGLFYTPAITPTTRKALEESAGEGTVGATNRFGDIWYDCTETEEETLLKLYHGIVHSALSPKFKYLQDFRPNIVDAGYQRPLLKYLEEALCEMYAQVKVHGLSTQSIIAGIELPIRNGYIILARDWQALLADFAVGTIVVGGAAYTVYVITNDE